MLAIVMVAICLVPAGAHLAELANKLKLPPPDYMIVQQIYAGWALFGVAIYAALALTLLYTVLAWSAPLARSLSLASFLLIAVTQVIFWIFTFPMNALTGNWTVIPEDFEVARRQWEYSHAVNAVLTFAAFVLIVWSVTMRERTAPAQPRLPTDRLSTRN